MKTSLLAILAAAITLASASVIVIDTDAHSLNIDVGTKHTDCNEFCADAGKQCRARGLPSKLCDVVRGQCAHECIETYAPLDTFDAYADENCVENCIEESHKCRQRRGREGDYNPLYFGREKVGYTARGDSCRDNCIDRERRCEQSGMPAWQCQTEQEKCFKDCSAPPSELVLAMYADEGCVQTVPENLGNEQLFFSRVRRVAQFTAISARELLVGANSSCASSLSSLSILASLTASNGR
ncbi:unnamed protein product [Peniophora sp. CBMAI 1063]|nr:unnamed protein product [Peniophora sp. CBMAI 1063]